MSIRRRLLHRAFEALYGPLVFLHEPAGICLFGPSWNGRRRAIAAGVNSQGIVLDLGCGGGHLLSELRDRCIACVGIDRSMGMLARARRSGIPVILGDARFLPIPDSRIAAVVCTYPGPWIHDVRLWEQLWRVTSAGTHVTVLFGGTVTRGRFARLRGLAGRVAYGGQDIEGASRALRGLGEPHFHGEARLRDDDWGGALIWEGVRQDR